MFRIIKSSLTVPGVYNRADKMSNPVGGGGEGQVPLPDPLDPRDNPKVLTVEDLEKAALGGNGGGGGTGGGGGGGESGNGGSDGGGQENRQI